MTSEHVCANKYRTIIIHMYIFLCDLAATLEVTIVVLCARYSLVFLSNVPV